MLLTLRQVAEFFSVTESTVARWVDEEKLPCRFDRAELLEWAASHHHRFSPTTFQAGNEDAGRVSLAAAVERGGVALQLPGHDRYEVFRAAIADIPLPDSFDRDSLLDLLMAREKSGGAAIGNAIAIPHPRYPVVLPGGEPMIRVCYLKRPLDYHAEDGRPVDTLFLMICPTVHQHLQLLARLSRLLQAPDFLKLLPSRPDKSQLVAAVRAEEAAFTHLQVSPQ